MAPAARILRTYVTLTLLSTLASSFIWGVNTLFLLDAGLTITQAFGANAFFTVGEVLFEVPTGVVADTVGRRASYLLGAGTLLAGTLVYLAMWWFHGPFWGWALSSIGLGLGFTFFSGATEAWLVDGLAATGYQGTLDAAFARGQVAQGVGMLVGTVAGGAIAQVTNLGVPYALRAGALVLTFVAAAAFMHDEGFTPRRDVTVGKAVSEILRASLGSGLRNPPVRWVMLADLVAGGVPIFGFYAMQPYLLQLSGKREAYGIAGGAAALVALAQIAGAWLVPHASRLFRRRTSMLLATTLVSAACMLVIALVPRFWLARPVLGVWAVAFAATFPVRQAYLNALVPSAQRATVLSFDNLLTSTGGAIEQPLLGRVAETAGYPVAYLAAAGVQLLAVPFVLLARRLRVAADEIPLAPEEPATHGTAPGSTDRNR